MKNFKKHFITIVLSCYAIFLLFLLITGTISSYINPKFSFLTVMALIIICAMIFSNLTKTYRESLHASGACHCCHHEESKKLDIGNLLLFLPLILSVLIIPRTFEDTQKMSTKFVPSGYQEYNQLQIGSVTFDTGKNEKWKLTHTKIFLRGKVSKSPILKDDEVIVYRLEITCCAADGIPMGILVKLPEITDFQNDDWVGVEGTIQLLPFDEKLKNIDSITAMLPPEKIYPYFIATKAYRIQKLQHETFGNKFDPVSVTVVWQLLASALIGVLIISKRIRYWVRSIISKISTK